MGRYKVVDGSKSRQGRRKDKKAKAVKRPVVFNGVVTLTTSEYARIEECNLNPGSPTEANQRGADLLRKLYNQSVQS